MELLGPVLIVLIGAFLLGWIASSRRKKDKNPDSDIKRSTDENKRLRERITELENQLANYRLKELQEKALRIKEDAKK